LKGFTLVELLLVTIIISVLLSVSVPHFAGSFSHMRLETAAGDIAQAIRFAQSRTIAEERPYRLLINTWSGYYRLLARDAESPDGQFFPLSAPYGARIRLPLNVICDGVIVGNTQYSGICSLTFAADASVEVAGSNSTWRLVFGKPSDQKAIIVALHCEQAGDLYVRVGEGILDIDVVAKGELLEPTQEAIIHAR